MNKINKPFLQAQIAREVHKKLLGTYNFISQRVSFETSAHVHLKVLNKVHSQVWDNVGHVIFESIKNNK